MGFITPSRRFKPKGALKRAPPVGQPTQRLAGTSTVAFPRSVGKGSLLRVRGRWYAGGAPWVWLYFNLAVLFVANRGSESASIWTLSSCLQVTLFAHRGGVDNGRVFTGTPACQVAGWS